MSVQVQADLDGLLDFAIPRAQRCLARDGSFRPFAATVSTSGEMALQGDDDGARGDAGRGAAAALAQLYAEARTSRDRARAVAFVADVALDSGRGIRVELEHAEGAWMTVVMPYSRRRLRKSVSYEPLQAMPAQPHVWVVRNHKDAQ